MTKQQDSQSSSFSSSCSSQPMINGGGLSLQQIQLAHLQYNPTGLTTTLLPSSSPAVAYQPANVDHRLTTQRLHSIISEALAILEDDDDDDLFDIDNEEPKRQ